MRERADGGGRGGHFGLLAGELAPDLSTRARLEVSATADNIEAQVPVIVAADMSPSELASQLDERGLPISGFQR